MTMTEADPQGLALRQQLLDLLAEGNAHVAYERATADLAAPLRGLKPSVLPYSPWDLIEHLRLAQWDILEFSRNPEYISPAWPEGYWPTASVPPSAKAWEESRQAFLRDRREMRQLVGDPRNDLMAPFPWGEGQTLLREALVLADHTAYHVGQLVVVRRLLGAWSE